MLTRTGTCISRLIGGITKKKYTHVSISFDDEIRWFYSFSRELIFLPLPAGLKVEKLNEGVLAMYSHMPCALYKIDVKDEVYEDALARVSTMMSADEKYKYSVLGLLLCGLQIPVHRKNRRFCSQFVGEILAESKAIQLKKDSALIHPSDYTDYKELTCIYEGSIENLYLNRNRVLLAGRRK